MALKQLQAFWTEHRSLLLFLGTALLLYVIWYILYELWLHPQGHLDHAVIDNTIWAATGLLKALGYGVAAEGRIIAIEGTEGLYIGDPCNGVDLFALFSGFILAFPGPWQHKLWYLPVGILAIHLLNILRVVALSLILVYAPMTLEFNHTYTFTFLVYGFIFLGWIVFANRFGLLRLKK